jgi:type III secretion protein U
MAEKTEKATPKKLRDARKKGQVAKAQDFPSAFTFLASFGATFGLASFLYSHISTFTLSLLNAVAKPGIDDVLSNGFLQGMYVIFVMSIPILGLTAFVGVAVTFLISGPVFSVEVFKPDMKKFNPVENIKQKFKVRTLMELLKNMLKIAAATFIVYDIIYRSLPTLIKTVQMNILDSMLVFEHFLFQAVIELWVLFIVISVLDLIFQKKDFAKQMMMEKFEVKQEYKNTEGDPQIKSKRKQIAQEIAYSDGPAAAVQKGKAVVTNPTHLAIVIGYEREIDAAPYILTMGRDKMAEHIVKLAETYNVPIMRNIPLAHQLWENGEIYQYIPEDTYTAVAEIIRWVWALQEQANGIDANVE